MTRTMTATEVKARILALLDEVALGEEIEITKHGRPVARLVPATDSRSLRGCMAGLVQTNATEDELFSTGLSWEMETQ